MDFTHYYFSRVKASLDEDRAAIGAGFYDIIKRGLRPALRLVNYYKGLPISYPATLVDYSCGTVDLDIHQQQAVVLERNRRAFIKCDYFDSAVLAEAQNVNVRRMSAALRNFSYVDIMAERREVLRLDLEEPTDAEIITPELKLYGRLANISLGGFSIATEERCPIATGTQVRLKVAIPNLLQGSMTRIDSPACLVAMTREQEADICRFSFEADQLAEGAISRFIFQRQVEIIREIKEAS